MKRLFGDDPSGDPVNPAPAGYDGPRCAWVYKHYRPDRAAGPPTCGLPAWDGAGQAEPRCFLHSRRKPEDWRARLEAAVASGLVIAEARLEYLDLTGIDLAGMDLAGLLGNGACLRGANLREARVSFAQFCGADLTGACLAGARGMHVQFNGACLRDADLTASGFEFGEFVGADLRGAALTGADFMPVELRGCRPPPAELAAGVAWRRFLQHDEHPDDRPEPA